MSVPAQTAASVPPRPRDPRRPWRLQTRLIVTITAIVSLILVLVAVATSIILGRVLQSGLETEVAALRDRTAFVVDQLTRADPEVTAADVLVQLPGAQPGFLLAFATASAATGAYIGDEGQVMALSRSQLTQLDGALQGPGQHGITITGAGPFQVQTQSTGGANIVLGLSRAGISDTIGQMLTVIALLTAGGLVLLAAATAWTVRAGLGRLRAIAETAGRVARQPLAHGAVTIAERVPAAEADPRTEVGQVGAALNTLLDHVDHSLHERQRNEERMRRFVADASHELRTPLASIRGYSELSLRAIGNAGPDAAAETTAQSLERIQAQSLRMTGIVEDLLLLARLDEGQELVYDTVDLSRLLIDAVGDAQAAGADHHWSIEVGPEPVVVTGDEARLAQVVGNLLANARVHTPAGTSVTAAVHLQDGGDRVGDAVITVHDDGPGIPSALQGELFERFARGDTSRARQTGGSGLGLSIARAIVQAHRGELAVDSRPGDTTFTVRLPGHPHF